jgi:hypothetical protein
MKDWLIVMKVQAINLDNIAHWLMALPNPDFHLEVDADLSTLLPKSHLSSNFFKYLQNFKADQIKKKLPAHSMADCHAQRSF